MTFLLHIQPCSGFVYGLVTGAQFLESGCYKKVLVVGADALTR